MNWRYLLPEPVPESVIALGDGVLPTLARSLGPRPDPDAPGAGLGVADRADRATLRQLAEAVRPGGAVYVEVPWSRLRSSRSVVRRVREAGFLDPVVYSLSPSKNRWSTSWWIPTGDPTATRFVAAAGRTAVRPSRSIIERLRATATRELIEKRSLAANHPWLLYPTRRRILCVVAGRALGRTTPGLLPWADDDQTANWQTVVMRVGGTSTDQAMLFGFDGHATPKIVIKAPTRSEEIAASAHEAAVLARLAAEPNRVDGVPQPVPLALNAGLPAWGQTFVDGEVMARLAEPDSIRNLGQTMTDWLIELAIRTAVGSCSGGLGRIVSDALRSLDPLWAGLHDGCVLRHQAEQRLRTITDCPLVLQHRDLGPWNIIVGDESLNVIDWADAIPAGPPLCDLYHFLTHLTLSAYDAYGPNRRSLIAKLTDSRTILGSSIDDALGCYADAVDLDQDMRSGLRVLTWLLDLGRRPVSEQLGSIYLELLRSELGAPTEAIGCEPRPCPNAIGYQLTTPRPTTPPTPPRASW